MPSPRHLTRRIPWAKVWAVALWLAKKSRDRIDANLGESEWRELKSLVARSRGRPGNLSARERERVRAIVKKAATGR